MSLERPDIKFRLDPEYHEALRVICDAKGVTRAQFVESVVVPVIRDQVHAATVIADRVRGLGISGNARARTADADK